MKQWNLFTISICRLKKDGQKKIVLAFPDSNSKKFALPNFYFWVSGF